MAELDASGLSDDEVVTLTGALGAAARVAQSTKDPALLAIAQASAAAAAERLREAQKAGADHRGGPGT